LPAHSNRPAASLPVKHLFYVSTASFDRGGCGDQSTLEGVSPAHIGKRLAFSG